AKLPAWAAGLAQLCIGFKELEAGSVEKARDAFQAYHAMPADETQRWAFNLQPLADKLARDCNRAVTGLAEINRLQTKSDYEGALKALRALSKSSKLPTLKAVLAAREGELQKRVEEAKLATEQSQKAEKTRQAELEDQQRQ